MYMYIYIYIYIFTCIYMYIYIYIYNASRYAIVPHNVRHDLNIDSLFSYK